MQSNCIKDLLNLKGVKVKKIKNLEDCINIFIDLPTSEQICPHCGAKTKNIKDYYTQPVKDIPVSFKPTILMFKKPRYKCPKCNKTFYPKNEIVCKYKRKTNRLIEFVVHELRNLVSASDISKKTKVSANFISKMLPCLSVTNTKLPRVLCIDEFKGNSGKYKYQILLINGETHEIVDVLECRQKHFLCDYFKKFPQSELDNVKYLVTDLWTTYKDIGITYFRKAKIIADHFHWARYSCQAVDKLRKEVQKKLPKDERKYFKHSRKLLLSRQCNLKDESIESLNFILNNYSEDLRIAYREKEDLLGIIHSEDSGKIKTENFNNWVSRNLESPIDELKKCAKTYFNWSYEIKNSLEVPYTNGPIEGKNNKIKVLKRVTYGMRNFENFKARILLLN